MYATPQASPAHSHSTPEIFGFMPLHRLHSHSTPGIFGFMPLHRLHLAFGGEPLSPFRSQGLLSPKYSPTFIRPSNRYKHTEVKVGCGDCSRDRAPNTDTIHQSMLEIHTQ